MVSNEERREVVEGISSDNVFGVELPKDYNGKVIPLDTEILYEKNGLVFYVSDFRYSPKSKEWSACGGYTGNKNGWCAETNTFLLTTPDSWDKLIDDLRNAAEGDIVACAYLSPEGEGCTKCQANATRECTRIAFTDILSRIERLRRASDD